MCQGTPSFCQCTPPILLMPTVLFIRIWKALVLAMLVIAFHYYIRCHSCSPPNLRSALISWLFLFAFSIYATVPKFLSWVSLFVVSIFLMATFSLIWGHALLRSFSVHLSVSGHFNNKWDSLSSPNHRRHLTFSVPPLLAPFSFQNSSQNHAVSLLYPTVDAQLVNRALDIQEIIKNSVNLIKVSLLLFLRQSERTKYSSPCYFIPHLQILFLEDKFQYKLSIYAKVFQVMSYRYIVFTSYMPVQVLAISSSPVLSTSYLLKNAFINSIMKFFQLCINFALFRPRIHLSILFSKSLNPFLGAFAKLRKAAISFVMSLHPHAAFLFPLNEFSWKFIF